MNRMASMPGDERRDHADDERPELDRDAGFAGGELAGLEDRGTGDDRGRHQEREPRGGLAVEAGEPRRPRSRSRTG